MAKPIIKTSKEIEAMRKAGRVAAMVLREAASGVEPGMETGLIDERVGQIIRKHGAKSAFRGYRGFPGECCISVNEAVIHGIGGRRRLALGDVVKLDIGVRVDGFVGDVAMSIGVGGCSPVAEKLMDVTAQALYKGISFARAGQTVNDIGRAVEAWVTAHGYAVVREFCGHGVGRSVHEEPQVPNYVDMQRGRLRLVPGMTIAIEPMVVMGKAGVEILEDKWTVITRDRSLAAHFEHTVLITEGEPEVLTKDELPALY